MQGEKLTDNQVFNGFGYKNDNLHHYELTIHALDVASIDLPADVSPAIAGFMIRQHQIGSTTVTAHYMQ